MQGKEKARAGAGTPVQAIEGSDVSGASSIKYDITSAQRGQVRIADLLPRGEINAISTRDLLELAGYTQPRKLQAQIESERLAGAMILSTARGGYFLPSDGEAGRDELLRYERTLRSRAVNTLRTLRPVRRALRDCYGQEVIGDE